VQPRRARSGLLTTGEIYNFAQLRRECTNNQGHRFASNTDTEVVLHLYEQEGADCVQKLNGMFAFAICDLRSGRPELFLARGSFWSENPSTTPTAARTLAFASEVKALLHVPQITADLDLESLHQYLTFLWVPDPKTMFRGIPQLPAGHCATFRDGELKIRQLWDLSSRAPMLNTRDPKPILPTNFASAFGNRWQRKCERRSNRRISQRGFGFFQYRGHDVQGNPAAGSNLHHHVSAQISCGETTLDDPNVPRGLARQLGCDNQQIVVEPDVAELLPRLTWHMDEPTAIPRSLRHI